MKPWAPWVSVQIGKINEQRGGFRADSSRPAAVEYLRLREAVFRCDG